EGTEYSGSAREGEITDSHMRALWRSAKDQEIQTERNQTAVAVSRNAFGEHGAVQCRLHWLRPHSGGGLAQDETDGVGQAREDGGPGQRAGDAAVILPEPRRAVSFAEYQQRDAAVAREES